MKIFFLSALVVIGVTTTLAADIYLKRSGFVRVTDIIVGIALYGSVAIPVAAAFRLAEFGFLFIAWEAVMIIAGITVATVSYGEALTTQRLLSLIFALLALVLSYAR